MWLSALAGGSSSSPIGTKTQESEVSSTPVVLDDIIFDTDLDNVPDIADFDDIEQNYYEGSDSIQNVKITSIPSRHYLKNFKNSSSFVVDLTAGREYTVEISDSAGITGIRDVAAYAFPIANNIPDVTVINPQGNALEFLDFGTFDNNHDASKAIDLSDDVIELSIYPSDNPYMLCYTFTPSVTGSYTIKFNMASADIEATSSVESDTYFDHVPTLFIYRELRDGTGRNEAGQYKRYILKNTDARNTVSMHDIMALRIAYNEFVYDVFLRKNAEGSVFGALAGVSSDQGIAYLECMARKKPYYGLFDGKDIKVNSQDIVSCDKVIVSNDDPDEQVEDTLVTVAAGAVSPAATGESGGTTIPKELYGIPYQDEFQLGAGFFALTGMQSSYNAVRTFELAVPEKKRNIKSNYIATFVSSQEDREKVSTTTANASLSVGKFGLNAGYSSQSKLKFCLTSTTFVIHYEEVESSYRTLKNEDYQLKPNAKKTAQGDMTKFRNRYGDYFVGGYRYGGTYDAFITITTRTMEELKAVKATLAANFNSANAAASADIAHATSEDLKKNEANISIQIITAGIDTSSMFDIPKKGAITNNIGDIAKSLTAFREALKNSKPENYLPVHVMLKRYSLLDDVAEAMESQDHTGLIPISPAHATKILTFNREKLTMDSYYNVIADLTSSQINSSIKDKCRAEYEDIGANIETNPDFYAESNIEAMEKLRQRMGNLSAQLKALGDRYVFYQILVSAQKKEEACAKEKDIKNKPFGYNGGSVGRRTFAVSTAVTSDIAAGSEQTHVQNKFGGKSWEPVFMTREGTVYCYVEVIANNTHDEERTADLYCIGRSKASFHFTCGVGRWLEWTVTLQSMRFNSDIYPFGGLQ